jgi:hypothetical protein
MKPLIAFALATLALAASSPASSGTRILARAKVSGPLASACSSVGPNGPHAAVDPSDANHISAVYSLGDSTAEVVGTSRDGGKTWSRAVLPGLTLCSGGPSGTVGDPFVAVGSGGRVAATAGWVSMDPSLGLDHQAIRLYLSRSDDGGSTFASPSEPDPVFAAQRGPVSFDPGSNNGLLTVFERQHYLNDGTSSTYLPNGLGEIAVAHSDDGGATFGPAVDILPAEPGQQYFTVGLLRSGCETVVVGTRVKDAAFVGAAPLEQDLFVVRSPDGGLTWSPPMAIGDAAFSSGIPDAAAGSDGTLYVTWPNDQTPGSVGFASSRDGGESWTVQTAKVGAGTVSQPAIAAQGGTIGLLFYDANASGRLTPKLATSRDDGATWSTIAVAGSFDPAAITGGNTDGTSMGPYQDLIPIPGGFGATVTVGTDEGTEDVWWIKVSA